jgi:uncharacterized protein YndB with AHSA1/START domain
MMQSTDTEVRCAVTVQAAPERAFRVFTERFDTWWPRSHSIGEAELDRVVIEPRQGGRWVEIGVDGSECVWGEVLAYDPPHRILLTWRIGGDWQLDDADSEIEVTFTPTGDGGTRVELTHSHFERLRSGAELRAAVGSDEGWNGLLSAFAEAAKATDPQP